MVLTTTIGVQDKKLDEVSYHHLSVQLGLNARLNTMAGTRITLSVGGAKGEECKTM